MSGTRSEDKVIKGAYEQSLLNSIPSEAKLIFFYKVPVELTVFNRIGRYDLLS